MDNEPHNEATTKAGDPDRSCPTASPLGPPGTRLVPKRGLWAAVFLGALLSHLPSLWNGYAFDDFLVLVDNGNLLRPDFIPACLTGRFFGYAMQTSWRPGVSIAYHLQLLAFGSTPAAFHGVGLLLHGITSILLLELGVALGAARAVALLGALAFAVHPLPSDAVYCVGFLADVMVGAFVCGALLALLRLEGWPAAVIGGILAFAACATKENGLVTLPLALLVLAPRGPGAFRRALPCLAAMGAAALAYLLARFVLLPGVGSGNGRASGSLLLDLESTLVIFSRYLYKVVVPFPLTVNPAAPRVPLAFPILAGCVLVHAVAVALAIRARHRRPLFAIGVAWFYLSLLPVANIIPIFNPEAARYLYQPMMGLMLGLASLLPIPRPRSTPWIAAAVLVTAWGSACFDRGFDWKSNSTLWAHEARLDPDSPEPWMNMAATANHDGAYREAESHARKAIALDPGYGSARVQLAKSLLFTGRRAEAEAEYRRALESRHIPFHMKAQAWFDLGFLLEEKPGGEEEAARCYREAFTLDHRLGAAGHNLVLLLLRRGQREQAIRVLHEARDLAPPEPWIAGILLDLGDSAAPGRQ